MVRKFLGFALFIALSSTAVVAQQQNSASPSVDRIRQVITYLASDALEGRRTGTPGANDAAHYIAGEMNRFGLRPGMQMTPIRARTRGENLARYLQSFPYVASVELGKNNVLQITKQVVSDAPMMTAREVMRVGEDWMPLGFSTNDRIANVGVA